MKKCELCGSPVKVDEHRIEMIILDTQGRLEKESAFPMVMLQSHRRAIAKAIVKMIEEG